MDRQQFDNEVMRAYPSLLRFANKISRGDRDAEDLVQDAMIDALRQFGSFRGNSTVKTWICSIIHYKWLSLYKRRKRVRLGEEYDDAVARLTTGPSQEHYVELLEALDRLDDMNPRQREAFVAARLRGIEYCEIAEDLQIPQNTVKTRVFYGKRALADLDTNKRIVRRRRTKVPSMSYLGDRFLLARVIPVLDTRLRRGEVRVFRLV